jgi:DNA-binding NarL/FixJ family response regulator
LIADDHPIFRLGLAGLISEQHHLEACWHAESAPLALEAMRRFKPDLVLLESKPWNMPVRRLNEPQIREPSTAPVNVWANKRFGPGSSCASDLNSISAGSSNAHPKPH